MLTESVEIPDTVSSPQKKAVRSNNQIQNVSTKYIKKKCGYEYLKVLPTDYQTFHSQTFHQSDFFSLKA